MAKKKPVSGSVQTPPKKQDSNELLGLDGRQREVRLITDKNGFTVTKEALNAPYSETFKTRNEAIAAAEIQINCTNR